MKRAWDLADLEVFCSVARRSSFTAAAADLGFSPAYVTKRIASLERALGVTLFHRTTRRVHIGPEGEIAYDWARKLLDAADGMHSELGSARSALTGTLRLSTSLRLGRNHVSHILALMRHDHPGLDLWLELVDRRVDLIAEGFDLDIRVGEVTEPHLVARRIAASARVLVAAPRYLDARGRPKTLAELAQHDCLMFRDREQVFGVLRMLGPNGPESVKVTGPMGSNQSDPVREWAFAGLGIVLLSSWDIAAQLADGTVERVLPQHRQPADIYAVMPTRTGHSARLQLCVDYLAHHLTSGRYALRTEID